MEYAALALLAAWLFSRNAAPVDTKAGVSLVGLRPEALEAVRIARRVYMEHGAAFTVTSTTEGQHMSGSLHYGGLALDIRTRHIPYVTAAQIGAEIKRRLGSNYDVVLEEDHIHVEYDPK